MTDAGHLSDRPFRAIKLFAPSIRTLQARIVALTLLLLFVVQLVGFVLINTVGVAAAQKSIGEDLVAGSRVFDRLLDQSTQRVVQGARLLSSDYAFRDAIATADVPTIESVIANHGRRVDADVMMVIGLHGRVIANTLEAARNEPFPFTALLARAKDSQQAAEMVLLRGRLYRIVVVPVLAPLPIAWIAVGFSVNDALASDLRSLTRLHVSFVSREGRDAWRMQGSTLAEREQMALLRDHAAGRFDASDAQGNARHADDALTRLVPLAAPSSGAVVAVLQRPLAEALEPFRRLQRQLLTISIVALALSVVASVLIARGIARPVRELASAARRIAAGDYASAPPSSRDLEITELAAAFRTMQQGIASRESRIIDLAYRDELTGLPNRTLFAERLDEALRAAGACGASVAVLLMDLDRFKYVNDTLGHGVGDHVLREVKPALLATHRARPAECIARLGGDEFAILVKHDGPTKDFTDTPRGRSSLPSLDIPILYEGQAARRPAPASASRFFPAHGETPTTLVRSADVAMYAAKAQQLLRRASTSPHETSPAASPCRC